MPFFSLLNIPKITNVKIIKECQETVSKASHSSKIIAKLGSKMCTPTYIYCVYAKIQVEVNLLFNF